MAKHRDKVRSSTPIVITGLVMVLLFGLFVIFLVSQGHSIPDVEEVKAETRLKNLSDLNVENQKILAQYRWIDKSKGVVGIPIDRAMDLVLVQLQSTQPHPAGPASTPAPQASPATSPNQASPAPSPNK
jgi:hypothetical protein